MTNQEIIKKKFSRFREAVHQCGNFALCDQMSRTLEQSLNLHEQLEGGYHRHHLTESDSHGWAVADGKVIVGSGASVLSMPNEYGSAEDNAKEEASMNDSKQKGVFSAVMAYPFEGESERSENDVPMEGGEPHDSVRFETKIQELLKTSAHVNFPWCVRKNIKVAMQK